MIAAQLGIGDGKHVLTGVEIKRFCDAELGAAVGATEVYARGYY